MHLDALGLAPRPQHFVEILCRLLDLVGVFHLGLLRVNIEAQHLRDPHHRRVRWPDVVLGQGFLAVLKEHLDQSVPRYLVVLRLSATDRTESKLNAFVIVEVAGSVQRNVVIAALVPQTFCAESVPLLLFKYITFGSLGLL